MILYLIVLAGVPFKCKDHSEQIHSTEHTEKLTTEATAETLDLPNNVSHTQAEITCEEALLGSRFEDLLHSSTLSTVEEHPKPANQEVEGHADTSMLLTNVSPSSEIGSDISSPDELVAEKENVVFQTDLSHELCPYHECANDNEKDFNGKLICVSKLQYGSPTFLGGFSLTPNLKCYNWVLTFHNFG